tara:strand:- start:54 stop:677 length:624 start_codon:yes stop_codon:yes gene_type:complete
MVLMQAVTFRRWLFGVLGLLPLIYLTQAVIRVQTGEWNLLGPEPGRAITHFTGTWGFNFLLISLAVTPVVRYMNQRWLMAHRRMLGLFAAFYISLHGLAYLGFMLGWEWEDLGNEVIDRPYLLLGTLAWLLLLPLVMTSTRGWQRRLKARWKAIHKLVYLIVLLAAVHYLLQIRASWIQPVVYTVLAVGLLVIRHPSISRKLQQKTS